jgi:nucleoside-diphosphate-sugar epimerase
MAKHVVVGAGAVGRGVAALLADQGDEVVIVSGSGRAPAARGVRAVALDAADGRALAELAAGAATLYNCANPRHYHRWATEWPPLAASLLHAAEVSGAGLVTAGNLYPYGEVDGPIRADSPLAAVGTKGRIRREMWEAALTAHRAGRLRATEARASDYIGPDSGAQAHLGDRVIPRVLAGKTVRVFGSLDAVHSWAFVPDVSRTLVALGADERSWGRAWIVPSTPALTQREAITSIADVAGVPVPRLTTMSRRTLRMAGIAVPVVRALQEVLYQFERPFVVDGTETTATFGIEPTPWIDAVSATLAAYGVDSGLVPTPVGSAGSGERRRA